WRIRNGVRIRGGWRARIRWRAGRRIGGRVRWACIRAVDAQPPTYQRACVLCGVVADHERPCTGGVLAVEGREWVARTVSAARRRWANASYGLRRIVVQRDIAEVVAATAYAVDKDYRRARWRSKRHD